MVGFHSLAVTAVAFAVAASAFNGQVYALSASPSVTRLQPQYHCCWHAAKPLSLFKNILEDTTVDAHAMTTTTIMTMMHHADLMVQRGGVFNSKVIARDPGMCKIKNAFFRNRCRSSRLASSSTTSTIRTEGRSKILQQFDKATSLFPFWVLLGTAIGFLKPSSMLWFTNDCITAALALTMVCMGMTMKVDDVRAIVDRPWPVFLGTLCQYTIMPLSALLSARLFRLPPPLAAGVVLVGCCPGGTASNLVSLIAQGDVALSVLMTTCSTLMAAFMTPLLTQRLVGGAVMVSGQALFTSTAQLVLAPVVAGLLLSTYAKRFCEKVSPFTPFMCVVLVAMICSRMVAVNAAALMGSGFALVGSLVTLHLLGFGIGYVVALVAGMGERPARTISIEVGMQNSALASVLAQRAFADPLCSLPGAVSATCHSLIGSTLAALWRFMDSKKKSKTGRALENAIAEVEDAVDRAVTAVKQTTQDDVIDEATNMAKDAKVDDIMERAAKMMNDPQE